MEQSRPAFFDIRMRGFRDRAEVADVLRLIDDRVGPLAAETIATVDACGRVLATDVQSEVAVPGFDRAAMDGYAVRAEETFGAGPYNALELRIAGEAMPGRPFTGGVGTGQAVRIMTGAPVPAGADAVVPVEATAEQGGIVRIQEATSPGRHIGRRGEDVEPGRVVMAAGRVLRPQDVGLLVSLGIAVVTVIRRPRVDILVTGDELLPAGARPEGYRIVDSNSPMLAALARRDGSEPVRWPILPDRREVLREAICRGDADALLISCLCAYDLFAGRALRRLGGRPAEMPYRTQSLPLAAKISSAIGRVDYVRVRIRGGRAEPLAVSGASMLSTTTVADGFILLPPDSEGFPPGAMVTVHCYDDAR